MLEVKNQTERAILYINGSIIDDEEGGWLSTLREGDTIGYEFPAKIKKELEKIDKNTEMEIHINSYGGSVFAGVAMSNYIANHKGRTIAICDGVAASIATQIFFACDICQIPSNAYIFVHKPECELFGNADDLRKAADTLDTLQRGLETTYQKKAKDGVTAEKITELICAETWLTGAECVDYFNVEVLEPLKIVNCIGSAEKLKQRGIKNIPNTLNFMKEPSNKAEQQLKIKAAIARAKGALL